MGVRRTNGIGMATFQRDLTWQAVKAESEADGPIVEKENVTILTRPEFVGSTIA
jgi:hypothetical protein